MHYPSLCRQLSKQISLLHSGVVSYDSIELQQLILVLFVFCHLLSALWIPLSLNYFFLQILKPFKTFTDMFRTQNSTCPTYILCAHLSFRICLVWSLLSVTAYSRISLYLGTFSIAKSSSPYISSFLFPGFHWINHFIQQVWVWS